MQFVQLSDEFGFQNETRAPIIHVLHLVKTMKYLYYSQIISSTENKREKNIRTSSQVHDKFQYSNYKNVLQKHEQSNKQEKF